MTAILIAAVIFGIVLGMCLRDAMTERGTTGRFRWIVGKLWYEKD